MITDALAVVLQRREQFHTGNSYGMITNALAVVVHERRRQIWVTEVICVAQRRFDGILRGGGCFAKRR